MAPVPAHAAEPRSAGEHETVAECLRKLVQLMPQITRGLRRRQLPSGPNDSPLGPRHGVALSVLRDHGPMTVGQLAAELNLTLATVSGIVAEVERAGFVQRSPDPEDRRRTIVALAEPHVQALGTWLDGASAPMARALDKLSPAERVVLLKAMALLDGELRSTESPGSGATSSQVGRSRQSECGRAT